MYGIKTFCNNVMVSTELTDGCYETMAFPLVNDEPDYGTELACVHCKTLAESKLQHIEVCFDLGIFKA